MTQIIYTCYFVIEDNNSLCKIWCLFIILEHPYIIPPPRLTNILQAKLMAFQQTTFFSMTNQPTCTYLQTTLLLFISFIITSSFTSPKQIHTTCNPFKYTTWLSNPSPQNEILSMYLREQLRE